MLKHLKESLRKKFNSAQSLPDEAELTKYWRERDPGENSETAPSDDEFIDLNCLWAVEFYTPEHKDSLKESFRKLGWEHQDPGDLDSRDPIAWLNRINRHFQGGSWSSLGVLIPEGSKRGFLGPNHRLPLPPGVSYALGRIQNISPSLNCVIICFVFEEDYSAKFDNALRQERQTYTTPTRTGRRIQNPTNQKRDHIKQIRTEISELAARWFREYLPGTFASGLLDGELPSCEFTTIRNAEPFLSVEEQSKESLQYLKILGLDNDISAWEKADTPGLRVALHSHSSLVPSNYLLAAVKEGTPLWKIDQHQGKGSRITYLDMTIPDLLVAFALHMLLEGFQQRIRELRQSTMPQADSKGISVKELDNLRKRLAYFADIHTVASELIVVSNRVIPATFLQHNFSRCRLNKTQERTSLNEVLKRAIAESALQLQSAVLSTGNQITQFGTLLGAAENIRVQNKISWLTVLLVVLTIVIIGTTLSQPTDQLWFQSIAGEVSKLWKR